jgi:fatty acid desaturase
MQEKVKINWYRTPLEKEVMKKLMERSDSKALTQVLLQISLFLLTGTASYLAFRYISAENWIWAVPFLIACLFFHGTFAHFMGWTATHELLHKTPFKNQSLNSFFLHLFSFISWVDVIAFRVSHVKHHQATTHHDHDGEVVLPKKLDLAGFSFWFWQFAPIPNPWTVWDRLTTWWRYATGKLDGMGIFDGGEPWMREVLPESDAVLRRRHKFWSQVIFFGHLLLAAIFIATGNWILILIVNLPTTYCNWFSLLVSMPQHIGMGPDTPDFRLCCRTYTCGRFVGFLYWNMQYHVEHHMYPAVPFYNLPALRKAMEHDLPPAPHGLIATWKEILPVLRKQKDDPDYCFVPAIPQRV